MLCSNSFRSICRTITRVLFPQDERTALDLILCFERFIGLQPFRVVHPADDAANEKDDTAQVVVSALGLPLACGFMLIFLICGCVYALLDPLGAQAISVDALTEVESDITAWLLVINAIAIFVQMFVGKRYECDAAALQRKFVRHLCAIGVDRRQAHRSRSVVMWSALVIVLAALVTQYVHSILFLERTVPADEQQYLWIFSVAAVMPIMYVECVLVQFGIRVVFVRIQVGQLNELLGAVAEFEVREARRLDARRAALQLGCY